MILEQISKLRKAGVAVIIPAHTKLKEKTDALTGEKYEVITNNLRADIYASIANIAQVIANINTHRIIEEGKQVGEKRMIHFRSNGVVDAGARFNDMPEMVELSARNFIDAFEFGVKSSFLSPKTDADIETMRREEKIEMESKPIPKIEEDVDDLDLKLSLKEIIQTNFPNQTAEIKGVIKEFMEKNSIKNFKDVSEVDVTLLQEIVGMFK